MLANEKAFRLRFVLCEYEACSLSVGWCACTTSARTGGHAYHHDTGQAEEVRLSAESTSRASVSFSRTGGYKQFSGDVHRDNSSLCEDMPGECDGMCGGDPVKQCWNEKMGQCI